MVKMKKTLLTLAVTGLTLLGLASCNNNTSSSSTPTPSTSSTATPSTTSTVGATDTIRVSGPAEHQEFVLNKLAELKASNTAFANVAFEYLQIGEDKVDSSVTDWSQGPDVYAYASDKILDLNKAGAMATIPQTYADELLDQMGEKVLSAATLGGELKAYPYAGDNGYFLYYDKSALEAADIESIEGLLAKAGELGRKVAYPFKTPFYNFGALFTWGADYQITLSDEGTLTKIDGDFDSEKGIKAAKAILKIMRDANWQDSQAAPTAENGLVACVDGGWNASAYKAALGDNFGCAKMPTVTIDGETKTLSSFLGYKLYGVNPLRGNEAHVELSHMVAKYLASDAVQESRYDTLSIVPTSTAVKALDKVAASPVAAALSAQSAYAHPQGATPGTVWSCTNTFITDIEAGTVTEDNIAEYMASVNTLLETI
jgi:sugar ABC transporter substrate-binding protein